MNKVVTTRVCHLLQDRYACGHKIDEVKEIIGEHIVKNCRDHDFHMLLNSQNELDHILGLIIEVFIFFNEKKPK